MAASLGMLKHLPCPAGNSCNAFQCLFKHAGDEGPSDASVTTEPPPTTTSATSSPDQGAPRKRLKLAPNASVAKPASPALSKQKDPLKRPSGSAPNAKPASAQPQTKSGASGAPSGAAAPAKAVKKAAPKKIETLNPRHIGRAPASHDFRNKLVKALHEQYTRLNTELRKETKGVETALVMSDQELIVKTLDDEQETATRDATIYPNVIKNRIMRYKRMKVEQWKEERIAAVKKDYGNGEEPQEAPPKPIETGLTPAQEVEFLKRLTVDLKSIEQYGYIATIPSEDDIRKAREAVVASGNFEVCDRCTQRFAVFPGRREEDGALASNGSCTYHPGRAYFVDRAPGERFGERPKKYRCCHQTVGDTNGCAKATNHVFKTTVPARLASVLNFAETPPNPDAPSDRGVSFDCEMGYTVYGMELIRLTAVSWPEGKELLDVLVLPVGEYIDLNTRYSGVRPEDLAEAPRWSPGEDHRPVLIPSSDSSQPPQRKLKLVPSPKAARDLFFTLISPDTPLIAHGAENDLNALRLIHPTVVDTIILYPHNKGGLPLRNSLKYLMESRLDRKIQVDSGDTDKPQGHDSAEDARAAGDLVRLKVKTEWEDMKRKGWFIRDGVLCAADDEWTTVGKGGKAK